MSSQTSKPSRQETYDAEERYKEAMMNNMSDEQWAAAGVAKARYAISFPSLTEFQLGLAHDMECGTRSDILGTDLSTELDGGIPQPNEWRDKHHLHRNNLLAGIHHDLYTVSGFWSSLETQLKGEDPAQRRRDRVDVRRDRFHVQCI
jgi:hypothetical protein